MVGQLGSLVNSGPLSTEHRTALRSQLVEVLIRHAPCRCSPAPRACWADTDHTAMMGSRMRAGLQDPAKLHPSLVPVHGSDLLAWAWQGALAAVPRPRLLWAR